MENNKDFVRPLEGIRVIDLSSYLAAPSAGRVLAYMGAEVIKVEHPDGDPFRHQGNIYGLPCEDDNNPLFAMANDGKKFITLNLKDEADHKVFEEMVKTADILITNMRTPALTKLGATYEDLSAINPKLVYGHITGYGAKGPLADRLGFDSTAYFARGGHMRDYVEKGAPPNNMMLGAGDCNTGLVLVAGVLAALAGVRISGKGRKVDVSLLHTSIWMASMDYVISQYGEDFFIDRPYRCKDGTYMFVQAITDKQKKILLELIGMTREEYDDHWKAIPKLKEIYGSKTFQEWSDLLAGTGVCMERFRHVAEVPKDRQARENRFLQPYGRGGDAWIAMPPVTYEGDYDAFVSDVKLGRDNEAIKKELGFA